MLLSFPGWCPLGSCKEKFTSGHSDPHPGMEPTHRDGLFRDAHNLIPRAPIREKTAKSLSVNFKKCTC